VGKKKIKIMGEPACRQAGETAKPEKEKKVKTEEKAEAEVTAVKVVEEKAETAMPEKKKSTPKEIKKRGKQYLALKSKVDPNKLYSLGDAVALVKETSLSKFVGNLEVHLVVDKPGDIAEVKMPFFKSKEKKVVVVDDKIIEEIEKGKLDFDILIASPKMMPKLVKFARVLGPKGLMPNPKNGTLSDDPEKAVEKLSGGAFKIKTEKKAPVVHLVAGKLNQPDGELLDNLKEIMRVVGKDRLKKMSLAATMGPGIKVSLERN